MYQALKELGCTVEFVVYPVQNTGCGQSRISTFNVLERSVGWFEKYAMKKGIRQ